MPAAIDYFLAQDYPDKQLIVLDDGADAVADLMPDDPQIRYVRLEGRRPLGTKRNLACAQAEGDLIAHWDDDDWYRPDRLRRQVETLRDSGADICGLDRVLFFDPASRRAFEFVYRAGARPWVYGATLCYRKAFWLGHRFLAIDVGEDTRFVFSSPRPRIKAMADNDFYVGIMHPGNTSPKPSRDPCWQPRPAAVIEAVTGGQFRRLEALAAPPLSPPVGSAAASAVRPPAPVPAQLSQDTTGAAMRISVGIRVDTEPERLAATLDHLRRHTRHPIEILLLPDGPDAVMQRALAGRADLPQLTTVERLGPAACLNRLLRHGSAELAILMEAGALAGPGWLDALLAALAADPHHGLAGPSTNRSWNMQAAFPQCRETDITATAAAARERFAGGWRTLAPLYSLADFCYAVRREVVEAIGGADEAYAAGPCWEMDYTIRAARAGFQAVWAQSSFVYRRPASAQRRKDEERLFEASRQRYQDKFCRLRLTGRRTGYVRHCRGDDCREFAPADLIEMRLPLQQQAIIPAAAPATQAPPDPRRGQELPLVSCIMPTRDRGDWLQQSISYFQRQDYPERELIIVDDSAVDHGDDLPCDPRIRYIHLKGKFSIGAKRNRACELARGSIIAHWDDDDWYGPRRISAQVAPLLNRVADITGLTGTPFFDLDCWEFWSCTPQLHSRLFVSDIHGGTLVFRRELFDRIARYPDRSLAEDAAFLKAAMRRGARLQAIAADDLFLYVRHGANAWAFQCGQFVDAQGWQRIDEPRCLASDRAYYAKRSAGAVRPPAFDAKAGAARAGR